MKRIFTLILVAGIMLSNMAPAMAATIVPPATVVPSATDPVIPEKTVKEAIAEFKSLSRKERRARMSEVKHAIKESRRAGAAADPSTNQTLLIVLAILLPPLAVYLHEGVINNKFWIDLLLTLLFFLPGVIYALVVVLGKD
jgi:uncharacterized membrane protein YqaE (UPF0057 family)